MKLLASPQNLVAALIRGSVSKLISRFGVMSVPRYLNESQKKIKLVVSDIAVLGCRRVSCHAPGRDVHGFGLWGNSVSFLCAVVNSQAKSSEFCRNES
jgi:hypothetical protein